MGFCTNNEVLSVPVVGFAGTWLFSAPCVTSPPTHHETNEIVSLANVLGSGDR